MKNIFALCGALLVFGSAGCAGTGAAMPGLDGGAPVFGDVREQAREWLAQTRQSIGKVENGEADVAFYVSSGCLLCLNQAGGLLNEKATRGGQGTKNANAAKPMTDVIYEFKCCLGVLDRALSGDAGDVGEIFLELREMVAPFIAYFDLLAVGIKFSMGARGRSSAVEPGDMRERAAVEGQDVNIVWQAKKQAFAAKYGVSFERTPHRAGPSAAGDTSKVKSGDGNKVMCPVCGKKAKTHPRDGGYYVLCQSKEKESAKGPLEQPGQGGPSRTAEQDAEEVS